ncbi:MAG: TonB-dependent receptor [Chitinophagaceae bacterium]|nr:TonB-dependent receptor [Chitinophagaceae bacterium]
MQSTYRKIVPLFLLAIATLGSYAQKIADSAVIILQDEPIINIGFSKQPVRVLTSAISTVKGSDLTKNFNTNLGNTLYGRIAGLTVRQAGNEPGRNAPTINGRGVNTFGPGSKVLIIIDGFIGDYEQMLAEEIEEISFLKDASATAIYGSRAANGVLLVTTKRGKESPLRVTFSTQHGFTQPTSLPKFLDSYNYALLYNEALANGGRPARYTEADLEAYKNGSDPVFHPNVDWQNEVLRKTAPVSNYNLSFRGGNNTVKYFVLLNNIGNQGIYRNFGDRDEESRNSTYNRFNFRSNVDVNLNKRLTATLLLGGSVEDRGGARSLNTDTIFNSLSVIPPNAFPIRNPDGSFAANTTYTNPVAILTKTGYEESNGRTLQSSFRLTQDLGMILNGLSVSGAVSFNNYFKSGSRRSKTVQTAIAAKNPSGDTTYTRQGQTTSLVGTEPDLGQYRNYAIQAYLNYHRVIRKHDITVFGVFNTDNSTIDKAEIFRGTSGANLTLAYKNNGGGSRITYMYNKKYIAEFSAAYMGSENYPPGNRYGFFPAGSVGWILTEERFLRESKLVNFLKIRGSYGITGNDEIGGQRFMFYQTYPFGASYFFGTNNATTASLSEGRLANQDVTWEKEAKTNIGLDATLFNRLDVSLDVFNHDRTDILVVSNRTVPLLLGYTDLPSVNGGELNNKGFEASIRYRNSEKRAFQFFTQVNVFYSRSKVVFDGQAIQLNRGQITGGRRVGQPFGLKALGLFATDEEAATSAKPIGITAKAGDIKYEDRGGPLGRPDGIIDGNDNQSIGKPAFPDINAGLHSGMRYKNFDLDVVLQAVSGSTVYLGSSQYRPFQGQGKVSEVALERWTPENAANATMPRLTVDNNANNLNNYRFSSFYQRDGSFIKLRSIELGYSLSQALIRKIRLQEARVFLNGTNMFSLDHIEYGDPEALGDVYPSMRTLTLGLRVQL